MNLYELNRGIYLREIIGTFSTQHDYFLFQTKEEVLNILSKFTGNNKEKIVNCLMAFLF